MSASITRRVQGDGLLSAPKQPLPKLIPQPHSALILASVLPAGTRLAMAGLAGKDRRLRLAADVAVCLGGSVLGFPAGTTTGMCWTST
ncbi:hypothetical protein C5748_13570 [Phyllobacterium phragmitis]|uniref:Uncharacterized protein n=1 Tax=Phyllobacterium phragmitis TaxID=2670329 RepID=A0A2S9IQL5_9HYPH|nr:hypothetical protein C5748_13570 [Phyllobacterium phragmitis]